MDWLRGTELNLHNNMASFSFEEANTIPSVTQAPIGNSFSFEDAFKIPKQEAPSQINSALARTGRDIVGGLGGVADVGYSAVAPMYQGLRAALNSAGIDVGSAQDTQKYAPSTALKALYDQATNNAGLPQNNTQAVVDKAGEMLAGSVGAGIASKAPQLTEAGSKLLSFMAPNSVSQGVSLAGSGGGVEIAQQKFPDSPIAPAVGALVGGALPAAASLGRLGMQLGQEGLARVGASVLPNISDEIAPIAQKAMEYNIPLSRSQIGQSEAAKTFASAAGKIPLSGAGDFAKEQQKAFNREVLSTIGANSDKVTPEIVANSYKGISDSFDNALKGQNIKINPDVMDRLMDIKLAAQDSLGADDYAIVQKQVDKLSNLFAPQKNINELLGIPNNEATIPGEKLGAIRSDLSGMTKGQGKEKAYLGQLKNLVQDVSVAGAPERQAQLREAIQNFRNYQIIKPLLNKAVTGDISPTTLLGRVAGNYQNFAQGGGGKLGDLARIGKAFLKDPIPDSGTAQRALAYKALEGAGALAAGTAAAGLPGAIAATAVPVGVSKGFTSANTSQRLIKNTLGMPSNVKIPKNIAKLPPAVALKAIQQLQEQDQ